MMPFGKGLISRICLISPFSLSPLPLSPSLPSSLSLSLFFSLSISLSLSLYLCLSLSPSLSLLPSHPLSFFLSLSLLLLSLSLCYWSVSYYTLKDYCRLSSMVRCKEWTLWILNYVMYCFCYDVIQYLTTA